MALSGGGANLRLGSERGRPAPEFLSSAQDPIGFLQPGFGVFAGLRVAFDTASPGSKP